MDARPRSRQRWSIPGGAFSLCFSHNGLTLAILGATGTAGLWDMATGVRQQNLIAGGFGNNRGIIFSADDQTVFIGGWTLENWNRKTGRSLKKTPLLDALQEKLDFTGKGIADIDRTVFMPPILPSPDGLTAASLLESGHIALWDVKTRAVRRLLVGETVSDLGGGGVEGPEFSPDGRWVAAMTASGDLEVWPTQSDTPTHQVY